jgi:hypothetical protein
MRKNNQKKKAMKRRPRAAKKMQLPHVGKQAGQIVHVQSGQLSPSRMYVTLSYNDFPHIVSSGNNASNNRYIPTYCYDVNPLLASTNIPGFIEYGGLYRYYRVLRATTRISLANGETFPGVAYIVPVNSDPGSNVALTVADGYAAQPQTKRRALGGNGGNNLVNFTETEYTSKFAGAWDEGVFDNYCAPIGSSTPPANNWYFMVGFITFVGQVSGLYGTADFDIDICFFEQTSPPS